MRNKRRISALLALVMIATSLFTGPADVRADELVTDTADEIIADEYVTGDDTAVVDEAVETDTLEEVLPSEAGDEVLADTEDEPDNEDGDVLLSDEREEIAIPETEGKSLDRKIGTDTFVEDESGMLLSANGGFFKDGRNTYELGETTGYLNRSIYIPKRDGYMFIGWFAEKEQKERVSKSAYDYNLEYDCFGVESEWEFREDEECQGLILYAGWTQDFYTVTYDFGDGYIEDYDEEGEYGQLGEKSYQILSGNAVGAPNHYPSDVRYDDPYYSLKGYVTDKTSTETINLRTWCPEGNVKEVTLYALWVKDKYLVTYDANTSDGGYYLEYYDEGAKRVSQNKVIVRPNDDGSYYVESYDLRNADARKAFAGWYLDPAFNTEPEWIGEGKSRIRLAGDTILYAKWTSTNKVVSFDPKGGFFYDYDEKKKNYEPKKLGRENWDNERFYLENPKNDDLHKAFAGWCDDSEGKNILFKPEEGSDDTLVSINVVADKTYYASWTDKYKVATFDAGDGEFTYWDPNTYETKKGSTVSYRLENNGRPQAVPSKPEYPEMKDKSKVFEGWYVDGKKVSPGAYTSDKDVTFTARYVPCHKVTLDACGGYFDIDGDDRASLTVRVPQGSYFNATIDDYWSIPDTDVEKKTFGGWYFDREYTKPVGGLYDFTPTADTILYAKWLNVYYITFNAGEGTYYGAKSCRFSVIEGESRNLNYDLRSEAIYAPEGKAFAGWFKDAAFTQPLDLSEPYIVTADVTFYAKYKRAYTVSFYPNGGAFVSSTEDPYKVQIAEGESIKGKVPTIKSAEDKVFKGWFEDRECTKEVKNLYDYPITNDTALYAGYDASYYKITFKTNNPYAKFANNTDTVVVKVVKGEAYRYGSDYFSYEALGSVPQITTTSEDKIFLNNWSTDAQGTGNTYYFSGSGLYYTDSTKGIVTLSGKYGFIPTSDMTFYANWADTVKLTLSANGGKFRQYDYETGDYTESDEWVTRIAIDSRIGNPSYSPNLSREGYVRSGWYLDPECTQPAESAIATNDITIYAGWKSSGSGGGGGSTEPQYTLTLHAGEGYFDGDVTNKIYRARFASFTSRNWYGVKIPEINNDKKAFLTWYLDEACTKPMSNFDIRKEESGDWYVRFSEEVTDLYAKYDTAYRVTLNANGGYFDDYSGRKKNPDETMRNTAVIRVKILSGNNLDISGYVKRIRRDGNKIFSGWYLDKACTQKAVTYVNEDYYEFFKPQGDVTLYAGWIGYGKPDTVTVSGNKNLKVGDTISLSANITPANLKETQVTHWWIEGYNVSRAAAEVYGNYPATLDSDGTLKALAPGSVTLCAEMNGVKSDPVTIEIEEKADKPSLTVNPEKLSLKFGEKAVLTAIAVPVTTGGNVTWTTSDKSIADVAATATNGFTASVTAGSKAGKATITAKRGNLTAKVEVEVYEGPSVTLDKHEASLISRAGSTLRLTATITGKEFTAKDLKWTSSNTGAATVSDNGLVTAVQNLEEPASTVIRVSAKDGKYYDECKVTVTPAAMLTPPTASVTPGEVAKGTRVLLDSPTAGADIYYTIDGSVPAIGSDGKPSGTTVLYSDAIVIDKSMTIRAIAVMSGYKNSTVADFAYTVVQTWGDLTEEEKKLFGNDVTKVPSGIWYAFKGEKVPYTTKRQTSINKIYSGDKITFDDEIKVFYGTDRLVDRRDYTISYKNNRYPDRAGKTPLFKVKFKGNYTGNAEFTFSIKPADLSNANVNIASNIAIKAGTALGSIKPSVSYKIKGKMKTLTENKDYDLTYYKGSTTVDPSVKAETGAEYKLTITGHTDSYFTGKTDDIIITVVDPADPKVLNMSDASVSDITVAYKKDLNIEETLKGTSVQIGSTKLTYGTDYTVVPVNKSIYPDYPSAGEYNITLRGLTGTDRKCVGDKVIKLTINGTKVTRVACLNTKPEYKGRVLTVSDLYKQDSSGLNVTKPTPYVTEGGKKVPVPESDYTVETDKLRAEGKFLLTYTFKNGYTGKITKKITVKRYNMKKNIYGLLEIKTSDAKFRKCGAKPSVTVKFNGQTLREGIDYKLSFSSNKKVTNEAKVTVKGIGNFTGSIKTTFKIERADLSNVVLTAKDKKYTNAKDNYKTTVKATDGGKNLSKALVGFEADKVTYYYAGGTNAGKQIAAGTTVPAGTEVEARATITCPEGSPYYGSKELVSRFRIVDENHWLGGATVTIKDSDNFIFAGGDEIIPLKKSDITVTLKGQTTPLNESDYDIVSVTNNRFVGKARIEIRGKGAYGGIQKQKFSIKKRK